jgi:DNA polymerase-3 subunit epsilon
MKLVMLLDTECTGLEDTDTCIEVAIAVYSVPHAAVVESFSSLIQHTGGNPAEAVNGIPAEMLINAPYADDVWCYVRERVRWVDAIIAHNAAFDRRFVPGDLASEKPWICSCDDLLWPMAPKPRAGLVALALAHGLGVSHAHRAAVDVDLLARLLTRVREQGTDLHKFLARGLRPKATFQALVPFDRKDEAKAAGFSWEAGSKRWLRTMAIEDAALLPFKVREAA